ncbi:MAG: hypothetical protein R2806_22475 [Saprospiraceae bacterium]
MKLIELSVLTPAQKEQIIALWNQEYPAKIMLSGLADFDQYLSALQDLNHIVLIDRHQVIKGWLAYFSREGEQWFAILLDASLQGQGWGTQILDLAKKRNLELHGWVIPDDQELKQNGEIYRSPLGFYVRNKFSVFAGIQSFKKDTRSIKISWYKNKTE